MDLLRRASVAILAASVAVALAGCIPVGRQPDREPVAKRDPAAVMADMRLLPGVVDVHLTGGSSGLPTRVQIGMDVVLEESYPGDLTQLLDYTLRQIWSETTIRPTTLVTAYLGTVTTAADLAPSAAQLGLENVSPHGFGITVSDMTRKYGKWPGPVPNVPPALAAVPSGGSAP
jgi:hypothetical protein